MAQSPAKIRGYLFDLDGTLYEAGRGIPGAAGKIAELIQRDVPHCFVTNTTSKPRSKIVEILRAARIPADPEKILTAPSVAGRWLKEKGLLRCHLLLKDSLLEDLPEIIATSENPQALAVGDMGSEFTHANLNRAFRILMDYPDCAFVTLARNRFFKAADGLDMDVGAYVAALEYASGRRAENIGKPSPAFFHTACASLNLDPAECAMVGDDLENDVLGAQSCGLQGILVRTGKFREEQLHQTKEKPNSIIPSIAHLTCP